MGSTPPVQQLLTRAAARAIRATGADCTAVVVDVADRRAVYRAAAAQQALAPVSILVNNAGVVSARGILELTDAQIERCLRVNTLAHFWTVRAYLPAMLAARRGALISIASVLGAPRLRLRQCATCPPAGSVDTTRRTIYISTPCPRPRPHHCLPTCGAPCLRSPDDTGDLSIGPADARPRPPTADMQAKWALRA